MITVTFSELTKKLSAYCSEKNIDKIVIKKNYSMFFSNCILCGYSINNYDTEKNAFIYNKKLTGLLNKDILELVK